MPGHVFARRQGRTPAWCQGTPMEVIDQPCDVGPGGELRGDEHAVVGAEAQRAAVEELVVQGAQSQAVIWVIGAAEVEPPDVGGFQADHPRTQPAVIPTVGALIVPGALDQSWPRRAASALFLGPRRGGA